jgi:hypothetical protein
MKQLEIGPIFCSFVNASASWGLLALAFENCKGLSPRIGRICDNLP